MSRAARRWLLVVLFVCVAVPGMGAILSFRLQNYRLHKIDFIIRDNQHENVANLSREQFTDYLQQCGARVDSSAPLWVVRYDGFLDHKTWSFSFVTPTTDFQ